MKLQSIALPLASSGASAAASTSDSSRRRIHDNEKSMAKKEAAINRSTTEL